MNSEKGKQPLSSQKSEDRETQETIMPPLSRGMRELLERLGHESEDSAQIDAFREVNLPDPIKPDKTNTLGGENNNNGDSSTPNTSK